MTLEARHVLEFPGGYTRTTGPVIGRFLTELRDGRLVGVRTAGGRTLVPPLEYDPDTGDAVTGDFVEVGPAGTVESWSWVHAPRPGHPLDRPFAWALIRLDGADTSLVHAVDAGDVKAMRPGLRVRPRWRAERTGQITDIESFVPEVTKIVSPVRTEYVLKPGLALARFLEGVAAGVLIGCRCGSCHKVYVPYRLSCPECGVAITEEVEVPDTGTITTFAINNLPDPRAPEVPFVSAYVLLDGSDVPMITLVAGIPAHEVRQGMRVRAVWVPEEERTASMTNIKWFAPTGEPDAEL
ncbi:Zn-ribbon domain-containing OB-fold protein [Streptosporangium roseum]|uniref:Nucleic-acid-binding protein containing a Zn-ribbon-like protein n=1 Tax=Streptosporangium roseum (strain ATCC 12428 / DSM 43021 / JCM 3005 / KCTC 9067 / NCIMB 10171 / NRRL 2505 / NI 9100) TaxID=479432 RepID=D2AQD1_STRRD|nr:OB-fold nucleic acid binding domain-containing protein [Streptosporangium roseum]ACZ84475.1 nucleic-acid-binding protein containing a Zn- ribbon-like protein [Streptosporangium roseum DSM 43021]